MRRKLLITLGKKDTKENCFDNVENVFIQWRSFIPLPVTAVAPVLPQRLEMSAILLL